MESFLEAKLEEYQLDDRASDLTVSHLMILYLRLEASKFQNEFDSNNSDDSFEFLKKCTNYIGVPEQPEIADELMRSLALFYTESEFNNIILTEKWVKRIRKRAEIMKKPSKIRHLFSHRTRKMTWGEIHQEASDSDMIFIDVLEEERRKRQNALLP